MITADRFDSIWFSSDHHFGHFNIIGFANRPFQTVEEMNKTMIDNWNAVVQPTDTVYHLGDLTLNDYNYAGNIIQQLNGTICLVTVPFHHDKRWYDKSFYYNGEYDYYTGSGHKLIYCQPIELLKVDLGKEWPLKITLCHYPLEEWEASYHQALHFHGHSHGTLPYKINRVDVGCDCWDFAPVSLFDLLVYCGVL